MSFSRKHRFIATDERHSLHAISSGSPRASTRAGNNRRTLRLNRVGVTATTVPLVSTTGVSGLLGNRGGRARSGQRRGRPPHPALIRATSATTFGVYLTGNEQKQLVRKRKSMPSARRSGQRPAEVGAQRQSTGSDVRVTYPTTSGPRKPHSRQRGLRETRWRVRRTWHCENC